MNRFSNDGSFLEFFKQNQQSKSGPPRPAPTSSVKSSSATTSGYSKKESSLNKNTLSRAFKQMSQLKEYSKPKLVLDESTDQPSSGDEASIAKEEPNEYDDAFPKPSSEPVTQKTHELIDQLVNWIVEFGDDMERIVHEDQKDNPDFWFLFDKNSDTYRYFRKQVAEAKNTGKVNTISKASQSTISASTYVPPVKTEPLISAVSVPTIKIENLDTPLIGFNPTSEAPTTTTDDQLPSSADNGKSRKRKSRWGPEPVKEEAAPVSVPMTSSSNNGAPCDDDFELLIAAEELKMAEQAAKQRKLALEMCQGVKYNSDDDEDAEENGGTKEHLQRKQEMERTEETAKQLTEANEGKTFIGDFIPPDELQKFYEQVARAKGQKLPDGSTCDTSDFSENKLSESNIGFKLLKKAGWSEGSGLGSSAQGVTAPVNVNANGGTMGLGMAKEVNQVAPGDDDVEIFRKRMMMAYKYRPNPLNNPRRPYY